MFIIKIKQDLLMQKFIKIEFEKKIHKYNFLKDILTSSVNILSNKEKLEKD